ncbi:MAG TPA: Dabb family protein [Dongiaceae bacterium]|nr:Dabb family protein [Dongiaceae bacterium]
MFRRVVLWRLRATDPAQKSLDAGTIKRSLESMRGKIPGLVDLQVGINVATLADASDVVMIVDFENEEALAVYEKHPVHEQVKPIVGPLRDERRVVEYHC